ncbi:MAG: tRNA 5-methoxyuridine(34)/uridine 5-oxyacetic acid(34) synthase CmoB [Pseudomonadales bacterium]
MPDYRKLQEILRANNAASLAQAVPALLAKGLDEQRYGDLPRWREALRALPDIAARQVLLDRDCVTTGIRADASAAEQLQLEQALRGLHPWRKGPFELFGVTIDSEWRSDFKWRRLAGHIEPLQGRRVLDIGCGNGYHCWRMAGAGAAFVLGVDPTPLFLMQFEAVQKYINDERVWMLPARCEDLPASLKAFDTVFSMGVLYHRRSPFDHLLELRDALAPGGQLVLETLVIEGGAGEVLVPAGRYGKMGNVWFIPSAQTLQDWLGKIHFSDIRLLDVSRTGPDEQRATSWMTFQSLADFLDPGDPALTVEGHPAPRRAIVTARI